MKEFKKTEGGLFICEECGKLWKNKLSISTHIYSKHNAKLYFDKWGKEKDEGFCKICKNPTDFITLNMGYHKGCCKKHIYQWSEIIRSNTNINKYGVNSVLKIKKFRDKGKKTKLEKYGNENFTNPEKSKKTCLEKYGVESFAATKEYKEKLFENFGVINVFQLESVKNKCKKSHLKNLGVEYPSQSEKIKRKKEKTCLERYGVDHNFKIPKVIENRKNTWIKNLGVKNPTQNIRILEKSQKTAFKLKQFRNTDLWYRGSYELDFLEKFYDKYPTISRGPSIKYSLNGKNKIYHSDFYIPPLNLIIEIKSTWILNLYKEQITNKEKSMMNSRFRYLMILDKNYSNFFELIKSI